MEIKDNTFLRQFEINVDTQLLSLEYSLQERKIFLTKLNVPEGISLDKATEFLKNILDQLGEQKIKVVPTAPKVASFFRKNPTYKEMLPPGIVI